MLNHVIQFCLKQRFLVLAATAAIVVWGTLSFQALPVDVLPNLNRPTVTVFAEAEGLAPEEVESLVAFPIETAVNGSSGILRVRSTSSIGLAIINLEFDWGTDVYRNRQIVQEKLQALRLPKNVHVSLGPITSLLGEVVWAGLTSPDNSVNAMELRSLADWTIRPKLLTIPGISNVLIMGGEPKQYQVLVKPERLAAFGLTVSDVVQAVQISNDNRSGGFITESTKEYPVRILARSNRIDDLKKIVISMRESQPITVADVADVIFAPDVNLRGTASIEGKPGVIMRIIKQPDADTLTLTKKIDEVFKDLTPSLPVGTKTTTQIFRQEWFINAGLHNVYGALRDGTIMVIIVLFLFLLNLRTTLITLLAIPLSLLITLIIFKLTGQSINVMTLGGFAVAIGELVDDAIVDVENVFRRLRENAAKSVADRQPILSVIFKASSEVRNSIVYATVLVAMVFIPLLNLPGVEGKLIQPLGLAYLISLLASLAVSLTVTPVLCYYLLPNYVAKRVQQKHREISPELPPGFAEDDGWLVTRVKKLVLTPIRFSLRAPRLVLSLALLTILISGGLFWAAGKESIPPFNEGSFTSMMFTPQGTSLAATNTLANEIDMKLKAIAGVTSVAHTTGRADQDAHDNGANSSEFQIGFSESSNRKKSDIHHDIQALYDSYQNRAAFTLGQPITHRMQELLSGVRAPIALKLYGKDLNVLRTQAARIQTVLAEIKGVKNAQVERELLVPQISISLDRNAAATHGLNVGMIAMDLETAFMGMPASEVLEGNERYPIVVKFDPAWRGDLKTLAQTLVVTGHRQIPLSELALIENSQGQNKISHEATQRRLVISAFVQDRDVVSIVEELKTKVAALQLPTGYFVSYEGDYQSQQAATRELALMGVLVLLGIFAILYWYLKSVNLTLQIMLSIPTAFVGGMIGVWLSGGVVSTASLIGFISLIGIVSRNGIMLVSHYLHLFREEGEPWGEQLVIRGSLERVVPVAMTALTASLALIPLILAADESGKEMLHPLAVVIFGGLISSTLLEVLIRPGIFYRFGKRAAIKIPN